jgi:betaine-aldehyde dehydrogenase
MRDTAMPRLQVFGPVLAVQTFETEAEAVAAANSTKYGLASTVMSGDLARARRVANKVRAFGSTRECARA